MTPYRPITHCRVGKSNRLTTVLNLGQQALTGVFPKTTEQSITKGPLELVWCEDSGLLQLAHTYNANEMYGDNYGYRSGLNGSMVRHLTHKINRLERWIGLKKGDVVLDIGSNDATTLKAYQTDGLYRIGIDPSGKQFTAYYPDDIQLVPDFFNRSHYNSVCNKPAKLITSIAMFYDLEDPIAFAKDIRSILADGGIWHFEQSYMPSMLRLNAYDTICHEHLSYYSLGVIQQILKAADLQLLDVSMNTTNGGSFAVTASKKGDATFTPNHALITWLLAEEDAMGLSTLHPYQAFQTRVFQHRDHLKRLIHCLLNDGKRILGYGASTKGNVLLQFCQLTANEITAIAEVNTDKFGHQTPGTHIPILSEKDAMAMQPDYLLVLPWHFKDNIIQREKNYLAKGGKFIFPFPTIEVM